MSEVSVVMPCHNRGYNIQKVLAAYDQQVGGVNFVVIAIDDASTDNTFQQLTSYSPQNYKLIVKQNPVNSGPAFSRNSGLQDATSPIIIIVGDDVVPHRSFIQKHLQLHEYYPERGVAILGHIEWPQEMPINTLMRHIDGIGAEQFSYYYLKDGKEYDFRHFYTANISFKLSLLLSVDAWFDTDFILAAFEDVELAYRLKNNGLRIIYSSAPSVSHYHYHTIWTFSKRQYNAGRMAWILEEKHPGILKNKVKLLKRLASPLHFMLRIHRRIKKCPQLSKDIELKALRFASFYEWHPNPLLDWLYLEILDYFWGKGLIQGSLAGHPVSDMLIEWQANRRLEPALKKFVEKAKKQNIPTPY